MITDWTRFNGNILKMVSTGVPEGDDYWDKVLDRAAYHGVPGPALDAVKDLMSEDDSLDIPEQVLLDWEGTMIKMEIEWTDGLRKTCALIGKIESEGIEVRLLKGYGMAKYWPKPNQRPIGDIDLWTSEPAATDIFLRDNLGLKVTDTDMRCKHSHSKYKGIPVENHHSLFGDSPVEKALAASIIDMKPFEGDAGGTDYGFCTLPPTANYIFLLRHLAKHFLSYESVILRQIVDFGLFTCAEMPRIDTAKIKRILSHNGMSRINDIFVRLASDVTGEDLTTMLIDPVRNETERDSERLLKEILNQKQTMPEDSTLRRLAFRARNFISQSWKYKYVPDSLVNHILHPSILSRS